jgi:hypothetical protein
MPTEARWRMTWIVRGECVEADVVICSAQRWRRVNVIDPDLWNSARFGPFVVAVRLLA